MENKRINISVVIPCYNEGKILKQTINSLKLFFKNHDCLYDYELIFVDDGSTDNTFSLLDDVSNIVFGSYPHNQGKGEAVKQGLIKAKYNNILLLDADLSVKPNELHQIIGLNHTNSFIVKGQRIQVKSQPIHRLFAGWCFRFLTNIVLNLNVKDTQCPFWVFHNINKGLFKSLKTKGFAFDCELLYKSRQHNIQIKKLDVDYFNDENSSVTIWKTIKMFFELIRIRFL